MTRSLLALSDRLTGLGVTRVLREATSDYWGSFEIWLVTTVLSAKGAAAPSLS